MEQSPRDAILAAREAAGNATAHLMWTTCWTVLTGQITKTAAAEAAGITRPTLNVWLRDHQAIHGTDEGVQP